MIPKLYQKDGTTLIGNLTNCIKCLVEEERNGLFEVTLQYPNNETISASLVYDNIIICDSNDTLKNQKFRIYDTRRMMNNTIEVYARHISFDLAYDYIDAIDITNQSCEYALNTIFRNSQFSTGYKGHSDIINAQNYKISNCNALEAIAGKQGSIIDTYGTGAEILRDNTDIYIYNKRGNDNGVSIEYAKNLTGFELQENTDDLITRIIPFATYTPEGGTQTRLDGPTCDSQYITNYSHPFIAEIDFSDKFEDNEEPTASKLQTLAQQYFNDNKCDLPKQNWKIEFIPLSKCVGYENIEDAISLCDTVTIKDTRYNINTKAKVIKTVYDVLRERYDSMELGEPRTTLGDIVNTGSEKGEQGPPGPQGPPGQDGNIGDFPDSVPAKPVLTATLLGFASIQLDWTYENQPYYWYEVYASKEKDFTPNVFDIIHKGQTSSYLYQAKPGETWYFRVCAVNSYGHRTAFSDQVEVVTTLVDNLENYFTTAAIGQAVVGSLTAEYMTAQIIKGYWIDAKNLSVTDGNGKRTLDIDSFGNVNLDVTSLNISSKQVATKEYTDGRYATLESSLSEVKQTADSITSTVKSISKGGSNLLLNTRWEGAVPGEGKCPEWTFNSGIHIYGNQGKTGYDKENTIYLGNSSTTAYLMYQRVPVSRIPRNKAMVVSCDINIENNVKGFIIGVDFYNNDTWVQGLNFFDETKYTKADNYNCKFTTPDLEYTHALFYIQHKGSNNEASGYLVIVGNLMLELGTKKTMWQPAYEDSILKSGIESKITQTANEVKFEFQQGGGFPNLVANGSPTQTNDNNWGYWNCTKYTGDNNYTELGFYSNKTSDNNCCLTSAWMVVSPGKTYSISFWAYCEPNVVNPFVIAKCADSNYENVQYPTICNLKLGNPSGTKWYKYKINWTAPSGITRMQLCFHQRNHTVDANYVTRIDQVMVIEGKDIFPSKWYPKFQEVESNTTTINKDGVNVRHSDGARTNLNATALNFYNTSNRLYAQVQGGMYKFWNGSQYVGYMGHTAWADTNDQERVIVLASEYGCSTSLSSRTSSNSKYQTWVATFGKDTQVNNTTFHKGCTLTSPHLSGVFKLYGTSAMTDTYPAQIYHASDGQLALFGDNQVAIGVMEGTTLRTGIMITEDGHNSNKNHIDFYGPLNMNGYPITNAQSVNSLSATSAQTYALRTMSNEETYSDPTVKTITDIFPSQTPTQGEIRWTDRETHFTTEVETGVYECYIEIPWWIAQNLENNYHVTITPTNGFYQYYVSERDPYYFIVRSDKDSMGFTFEIVGKLLDSNTAAHNASIASDQYGISASEAPDIIPEFDITDIEPAVLEDNNLTYPQDIIEGNITKEGDNIE